MVHEVDLDLVGFDERFIAFAQRPFHIGRVGDVLERHQRSAIRQRHRCAIDDAAVSPLQLAGHRHTIVDGGRGRAQGAPQRTFARNAQAPADYGLDMRMARQRRRVELPHARECRVEKPQAPVAPEHRDGLGEVVERFALHLDQGLIPAFQIKPSCIVVEQIDHAAFRIWCRDDA